MEKELFPLTLRRLRSNALVRELVNPFRISHRNFIQPLFVEQGLHLPREIDGMNGISVDTPDTIFNRIDSSLQQGINKFLLFPVPVLKTQHTFDFNFASDLVNKIKLNYGREIWLATDVCLCSYTESGHCGILNSFGDAVLNQESVDELSRYALNLAQAGADCIAPSDMMDGRIKAIRENLNLHGHESTLILSYSAKFSSQWYGPFRDACHSAPNTIALKDRKTYQISPMSAQDAISSAERDDQEGADILMVKPATNNTDILYLIRQITHKPLAVYHVSGEYAAIEMMANRGLLDRTKAHLELWSALQRSGANIIISYAAPQAKSWIENMEF